MNLEVIKKLSEKRVGGLKKLATDVGMSEQNLHRCIRNNKIQASDLEMIANLLDVDISIFFDKNKTTITKIEANGERSGASQHGNVYLDNSQNGNQQQIELLKQLLEEKDKQLAEKDLRIKDKDDTIAEKERTIQLLMGKK